MGVLNMWSVRIHMILSVVRSVVVEQMLSGWLVATRSTRNFTHAIEFLAGIFSCPVDR
jgi:hypothetical protein